MTDPGFILSNDPTNPYGKGSARSGRAGMSRMKKVLLGGGGVVFVGMILFQGWAMSLFGGDEAQAALEIEPTQAEPPRFVFEQPPPPPPAPAPAASEPPPPAARAVSRRPTSARDEGPTAVAFNVQPQGEPDLSWFADGRRPRLAPGCALRPGASLIPAVLLTVVRSEVSGQVIAEVSEDVPDADGYGRVLIPQGTKVVGQYESERLSFQSRRLAMVWTELTMPDGTQLNLDQSYGMDAAGSMGLGGEVTTRWGQLIAAAALFSIFNVGQRGVASDDPTLLGDLQDSTLRTTGQMGRDVTQQIFQWRPEILIQAGEPITISPRKTVRVC